MPKGASRYVCQAEDRMVITAVDRNSVGAQDRCMEIRIKKLENDFTTMKVDMAVIKSNYASKADIVEAKNTIILWVVSVVLFVQLLPAILRKFGM